MKTSVFVGASVDGFIARPNGAFDFLSASGAERDNGYDEFFSTVNALLIGRNTYEIVLSLPVWPYGRSRFSFSALEPCPPGLPARLSSGYRETRQRSSRSCQPGDCTTCISTVG